MMIGRGDVVLVNGKATIPLKRVPLDAFVLLSRLSPLGTIGDLSWSITDKTALTITSLSPLDNSTIRWMILV